MIAPLSPSRFILALGFLAVAATGCNQDQQNKYQRLSRANDYFASGQYERAETEYRAVLRTAPNDPMAGGRLGVIYLEDGKVAEALPLLKKAAEAQSDDLGLQLKLGLAYLSIPALPEAREAAVRVLKKQPGNEDALLLLADTTVAPEDFEETKNIIETLREHGSDRSPYHLALGLIALRQKDQARAETELEAARTLGANSSALHFAWGNLYWARGDITKADQEFKAASDLAPFRSFQRLRYVDFKLQTGALGEAKTALEEITARAPDYLTAHVYLMKLVCEEHRDVNCAARIESVLTRDALNYDALLSRGKLHLAKGDSATALREFKQMSDIYKRTPQVHYLFAVANLQSSQNPTAVESAEKSLATAINLDPHFHEAALLLAELMIRKGRYVAAIDLLAQVIKERPQISQAHLLLASAYLAQKDQDHALATYQEMSKLFPKDPQPQLLIGLLKLGKGQQRDAREAFERSLVASPNYLPSMEKLVDLDIADKQYASALRRVQKQLEHYPKLPQLLTIRGKIYLAQHDLVHAEADLLQAIDLDPNLQLAQLMLAGLYVGSDRREQAIEKLTVFVENNKDVPALMQLATIHEQLKHFDAARDAYEKALAIDPNFVAALNNLAALNSEHLAKLDRAYDLASRARQLLPEEPHTADTFGSIFSREANISKPCRS